MSVEELKDAVKEELEKNGLYQKIKAQMQAYVCQVLVKEPKEEAVDSDHFREMDALVIEYLKWRKAFFTEQIFYSESGLEGMPMSRENLLEVLNLNDTTESRQVPLLAAIVEYLKKNS